MTIKTYAQRAAESCEWCAKGFDRFHMGPTHHWIPRSTQYLGSNEIRCAAPTREQYEQELRDQITALTVVPTPIPKWVCKCGLKSAALHDGPCLNCGSGDALERLPEAQ